MWTPGSMLNAICAFYNVNPKRIKFDSRQKELVRIRDAFVLIAKESNLSYSEIARILKKHHTTIITAHKRALKRDAAFQEQIRFLRSMFNNSTNSDSVVNTRFLQ